MNEFCAHSISLSALRHWIHELRMRGQTSSPSLVSKPRLDDKIKLVCRFDAGH